MSDPIPMLLFCPMCNTRHVDEGEFATKVHHTHACQNAKCGMVWRPAIEPTVGVWFLPGFNNALSAIAALTKQPEVARATDSEYSEREIRLIGERDAALTRAENAEAHEKWQPQPKLDKDELEAFRAWRVWRPVEIDLVFDQIRQERARQDRQWGGDDHDDEHNPGDWLNFIDEHRARARKAVMSRANRSDEEYRKQLVEIAALAVAATQAYDRKSR